MAVGVAILGAGFMGRTHLAAWQAAGDRAQVRAVASRGAEKAAALAADAGAEVAASLEEAVARPDVDVVDVCLPTPLHRPAAEAAFAAGKHVLLEKPIALTIEDGEAIAQAAAASGRLLLVGFVLRFWPEYRELLGRVRSGSLGTPRTVTTARLSPPADWNQWMIDPVQSGGVAVDLLVHDFDFANAVLGEPVSVLARARRAGPHGAPQAMQALVSYRDGGTASCEGSLMMPGSYPFSSLARVSCDDGVLEYPFSAAPAADGGNIGGVDQAANRLRAYGPGGASAIDVASGDPWHGQVAYALDMIESGTAPSEATGAHALLALRVALAANRSLESGRAEPV